MRLKQLILLFVITMPSLANASYIGSQVNYNYSKTDNRIYLQVKYWRFCNDSAENLIDSIEVEIPGCSSFKVNTTHTTIKDVSLHSGLYPNLTCKTPNSNNKVRGLEEFVGSASFSLDTAPFKTALTNGCCSVYFNVNVGINRSKEITTGVGGLNRNYAFMNICNMKAANRDEIASPDFLLPMITDRFTCNNPAFIDFGAFSDGRDSVRYELAAAIGKDRADLQLPTSPLTLDFPMTPYCIGGGATCKNFPTYHPPTGFYFDPETSEIAFTPTDCNQTGVTVIQGNHWATDTNGVNLLVGRIRREITVFSSNIFLYVNQPPEMYRKYDLYTYIGDSILFLARSIDIGIIPPPPIPTPKQDTTYILAKTNHPNVSMKIVDSTQRERQIEVKFKPTTADLYQTIVCAMAVYDQDSLPLRNMRSYRIQVRKKLDIAIAITTKPCGTVEFNLTMDSFDYSWVI